MKSFYDTVTTYHALQNAWRIVRAKNAAGGIDGYSVAAFERNLHDNLNQLHSQLASGQWTPEPYLNIEIPKNETEKRKLGLLCIRDKIVQQAIKSGIEPRMEKLFLNISYGYRPEKSAERAIRRTMHDLKKLKGGYIAKLDIDDFFDNIRHERLFSRLKNWLQDNRLLQLIQLCIQMGQVTSNLKWNDVTQGVPQGAVLSPLLANFYLHPFDQFVKAKAPVYIRYADDFIIAAHTETEVNELIDLLQTVLNEQFFLKLNPAIVKKASEGVEFLGMVVTDTHVTVTKKKKEDLKERIRSLTFSHGSLSGESQKTLAGIRNYYAKLIDEEMLKELDCELMQRLQDLIKRNLRHIASAKTLTENLQTLEFFSADSNRKHQQLVQQLCSTYVVYLNRKKQTQSQKQSQPATKEKLIKLKKKQYQKLESAGAELVVSTPGSYIGASYKSIVVKQLGKVIGKSTEALRHITVIGKGISLSSNALMFCMNRKIPIDFFDGKGAQYASVLTPQFVDGTLWTQQSQLPLARKVELASQIIIGKMKNQLNLIKYYHKYHKDVLGNALGEKYVESVLRLKQTLEKAKQYDRTDEQYAKGIMAIEAQGALAYWDYIRTLLSDDKINFERRERQGATDLLNVMLNYGYAILYSRVWKTILAAKLNPSIGILHAPQHGKPTLVYDVVEIFRPQMVDRVVISLVQKNVSLKVKDGLLNEPTKRTLIRSILNRLNRYEKYRKEELTLAQILFRQSQEIAKYIAGEAETFKPYVAKW